MSSPAGGGIESQSTWTCRSTRVFAAIAGAERSAPITVKTPSCADRLDVHTRSSVGLGDNIRVSVFDEWRLGDFSTDICAVRPDAKRTCSHFDMPPGQFIVHGVFPATRAGEWRIELSNPAETPPHQLVVQRKKYPAGQPKVLATGDSMMLTTTVALRHQLSGKARTIDDVYAGSGISRPFVIDWAKLPGQQVKAYRPDATIISLGMGDGRALSSPDGTVSCCGPEYVAAYAKRARPVMQTYSRGGRGAVVWLNDPFQRDPAREPQTTAVNAAVAEAARGLERVKVIDLAAVFTPDGTYQQYQVRNGTRTRVRAGDGIHLSPAGARIASRLAITALHKLGVKVR